MKILFLNDTRSEAHVGCDLVMSNTFAEAERVKLEIIETVSNQDLAFGPERVRATMADLVLINGEGTMHDDLPKAVFLARAAQTANELGKKVVLFNTVWQQNHRLDGFLKFFDLIFCRESLSMDEIRRAGVKAETVPDMIFARPVNADKAETKSGTVVIDSVRRKLSVRLACLAIWNGRPFLPMCASSFAAIHRRRCLGWLLHKRCGTEAAYSPEKFLATLASSDRVISGRFHGTCLAFLLGKPVVSFSSNTHKTEGLYRDIGLDAADLRPQMFPRGFEKQFAYTQEQWPQIEKYVSTAPRQIAAMFDQIQTLR